MVGVVILGEADVLKLSQENTYKRIYMFALKEKEKRHIVFSTKYSTKAYDKLY